MFRTWLFDIKAEFKGYSLKKAGSDALAGITVAAVALPLALAFGVSSGADAAAGLITAILAGIIIGFFSGSPFQISGPTGAMTAILVSVIAQYGMQGMFAASLISGIILLIAGIFKIGKLVTFIPSPVISGFTSGIAVVIALGQVGNFLGVPYYGEDNIEKISNLIGYFSGGYQFRGEMMLATYRVNPVAIGIAVFTILLMVLWPKKWNMRFPASLLAVLVTLGVNLLTNLPVAEVGAIPQTLLPDARLTEIPWKNIGNLLVPAFSIAALGMIESLLCGVAGGRMTSGVRFNADRELVAQGLGNIIIPFFGGVPATAAIARTSVGIKSGAKTRLTGIIHSLILLAAMLLLAPVMSQIPMAALAGVLMVTAFRMNEWHEIRRFFSQREKTAIAQFLVTLAVTVVFDLVIAIAVGVGVSILIFVAQSSQMVITVDSIDKKRLLEKGVRLPEEMGEVKVAYLSGPLFFGSVERLHNTLSAQKTDILVLSMRGVNMIDSSGVRGLEDLYSDMSKCGVTVLFSAIQDSVKKSFDRAGFSDKINIYWSTDVALSAFAETYIKEEK